MIIHRTSGSLSVPSAPAAITPQPWPAILLPLKLLTKPGDRGLGDIVARTIGPFGGDAFKAWHLRIFGKPCGCANRQEDWNRRWPLK